MIFSRAISDKPVILCPGLELFNCSYNPPGVDIYFAAAIIETGLAGTLSFGYTVKSLYWKLFVNICVIMFSSKSEVLLNMAKLRALISTAMMRLCLTK